MSMLLGSTQSTTKYDAIPTRAIFNIFELDTPSNPTDMFHLKQRIKHIVENSIKEIQELIPLALACIKPLDIQNTHALTFKCAELRMHAFEDVFTHGALSRPVFNQLKHFNLISVEGRLTPPPTAMDFDKELADFFKTMSTDFKQSSLTPHELAFKINPDDTTSNNLFVRTSCYTTHLEDLQILNTYINELEEAIASCKEFMISQEQFEIFTDIRCHMGAEKEFSPIFTNFNITLEKIKEIKNHILPKYKAIQSQLEKELRKLHSPILELATLYKTCYEKLTTNKRDLQAIEQLKSPLKILTGYVITPPLEFISCASNASYLEEIRQALPVPSKQSPHNLSLFTLFDLCDLTKPAKTEAMRTIKMHIQSMQASVIETLKELHRLADHCIQDFTTSTSTNKEHKNAALIMQAIAEAFTNGTIKKPLFQTLQDANLIHNGVLSSHPTVFQTLSEEETCWVVRKTSYLSFVKDLQQLNTYISELEFRLLCFEENKLTADTFGKIEPTIKKVANTEDFVAYKKTTEIFLSKILNLKTQILPPLKKLQSDMFSILTTFKAHTLVRASTLITHHQNLSEDPSTLSIWLTPLFLRVAQASRYIWHPSTEELTQTLTKKPYIDEMTELLKPLKDA